MADIASYHDDLALEIVIVDDRVTNVGLVITACADRRPRLLALEAGAAASLNSPVEPSEFRGRIRNLLRSRCQQRLPRAWAMDLAAMLTTSLDSTERKRARMRLDYGAVPVPDRV